jgi:hypothetical protein
MQLDIPIRPMPAMLGCAVLLALTSFKANGQELIYGVSDDLNQLISFSSATPGTINSTVNLTGLASGEQIRAIDWIGTTLYGLGSESHLYTINTTTGAATPVGSAFTTVLSGVNFGLATASTAGPLYVASDLGQNLGVNPTTGVATVGTSYTGAALDTLAYDHINNSYLGVSAVTHNLYTVVPTTGAETLIGATGVNFLDRIGLTVSPTLNAAYFSATVSGSQQAGFYSVNPSTGALTFIGNVGPAGAFTSGLDSIADTGQIVVPEPTTEALVAIGGGLSLLLLRRKNRAQ